MDHADLVEQERSGNVVPNSLPDDRWSPVLSGLVSIVAWLEWGYNVMKKPGLNEVRK